MSRPREYARNRGSGAIPMSFLGLGENEYGTPVSRFRCEVCGSEFTVCPVTENHDAWAGCLAPECDSYDPNRDVDLYFESPEYWKIIHGDAKLVKE